MKLTAAAISEIGPRTSNEDVADFWRVGETLFAAVADGLGGMGGGESASRIAISALKRLGSSPSADDLRECANTAHAQILSAQKTDPRLNRMATTLTAVAAFEGGLVGVHVGDSRASVARGSGIKKLTTDHSEGQRFYQSGKLSREELATYPRNNIIESALGIHGDLRVDTFTFPIRAGDKVFLSTDGVHNLIFLRELREIASHTKYPEKLVEMVAGEVVARGPKDNFSFATIFAS